MLGQPPHRRDQRRARCDIGHRARVQQGGIGCALIVGQEGHVRDPREALERAPDLPTRVDSQRTRPHLIGDDGDPGGGPHQSSEFGVVTKETRDREGIGGGDGDYDIGLAQHGGRRGMTPGAGEVI